MSDEGPTIYLDHGATSWPKPPAVREALLETMQGVCANAGRSGHRASLESARLVFDVREAAASLLGVADSTNLVYTRGTTEGANLVLKGFLGPGDLVLITPMEHNAVLRPLERLVADRGVRYRVLPADPLGLVDWEEARRGASGGPPPKLVVVCHGSNVNGAVQDLEAARRAFPDSALFVDAAQTAGVLPLDVERQGIDFLACSAHKGLLGPTGVGFCFLDPKHDVAPLLEGGTGSRSEHSTQPVFRPDRYESGTQNLHGIAALKGALAFLEVEGLGGAHKRALTTGLLEGVRDQPRIRHHGPGNGSALLASVTVEGLSTDRVAHRLEKEYGILCRPGLHCAPVAHRHLGTFPEGTVRLAPGWGNTEAEISRAVEGLLAIAAGRGS